MPLHPVQSVPPSISNVEILVECEDRLVQAGRLILVGHLHGLLGRWLRDVGLGEKPGVLWSLHGNSDSACITISATFRGVLGRRMRRYLCSDVVTDWRWAPADASSWDPDFGTTFISVDRLWQSRGLSGSEQIHPAHIRGDYVVNGCQRFVCLGTNGFIAIDLSQITMTDRSSTSTASRLLAERVLQHPDIWRVIGPSGGDCNVRLRGDLDALLDRSRPLIVAWDEIRGFDLWMDATVPARGRARKAVGRKSGTRPRVGWIWPEDPAG